MLSERLTPQRKLGTRSVDSRLVRHTEQILNLNQQVNERFLEFYFHFRFLYAGLILALIGLIFLGIFMYIYCGKFQILSGIFMYIYCGIFQ